MSQPAPAREGRILWHDLTVPDAESLRRFYEQVVGWRSAPVAMGDYDDYCMNDSETGETRAGVCHARGENAKIPPQWLMYITIADVDAAAQKCVALGGAVVDGPRSVSGKRFCVIRDPAGAVAALIQP